MKRNTTGIVVAAMCAAFGHSAEAAGLKGLDINSGLELFGVSSRQSVTGDSFHLTYGEQSTVVSLGAGYSRQFGHYNLGAHVSFYTGDVGAGKEGSDEYSLHLKLKSLQTLSFEPGWAFSEKVVGYLRLSYLRGDIKARYTAFHSTVYGRGSSSLNAAAFGFGLRTNLTQHLYLAVEADRAKFGSDDLNVDFLSQGITVGSIPFKEKSSLTRGAAKLGWMF